MQAARHCDAQADQAGLSFIIWGLQAFLRQRRGDRHGPFRKGGVVFFLFWINGLTEKFDQNGFDAAATDLYANGVGSIWNCATVLIASLRDFAD